MSSPPKAARRWMPEEDQRLRSILASIEAGTDINWHHVAAHIPGRNNKECRKRWIYALMPTLRKGPWNEKEDALLLKGVDCHGLKWPLVSQAVGTRQPDQCSRRWHESLNPHINHGRWSLVEDQILREAVQTYGRRWTEIVERYFPNRTPIAAKKRYAQSNQNNLKQTKIESQERGNSSVVSDSKSSASIKREDSDNSSQLLWCVPDHSTSFPGINKSPLSNNVNGAVRYVPEPSLSAPAVPLMSQFNNTIGVTRIPYPPSPDTPHYSPTYSQDGSLGGASAHDYPAVSNDTHVWMPAESQSAYSGSPFLFHDTGYFDPTYAAYVPATLTNQH